MERYFNTAGPNRFDDSYSLNPFKRIDYREVMALIGQKKYFVLNSPYQSGKTTTLLALMYHLNKDGKYRCVHLSMSLAQHVESDVKRGMTIVVRELARQARDWLGDTWPLENWQRVLNSADGDDALYAFLWEWLSQGNKDSAPLVLLLDDVDMLSGDMLASVLRQLKVGFHKRPHLFPQNVFLSCSSDIREQKIRTSDGEVVSGASCLGIKTETLTLANFTAAEIQELYEQHTADTKQVFAKDIYPRVCELTGGQPWLVNALAREAVWNMRDYRDRSRVVDLPIIEKAAERLISQNASHVDSIEEVLQDPKAIRVIAPILAGGEWGVDLNADELRHVKELGLIERPAEHSWRVANKIYQEVIPRVFLAKQFSALDVLVSPLPFVQSDGKLNLRKLIGGFQQFYSDKGEAWKKYFPYEGTASYLLFQAYVQAVLRDKGSMEREYELGGGKVDIFISWNSNSLKSRMPSHQLVAEAAGNKQGLLGMKNPYANVEGFDLFGSKMDLALRNQRFVVELRVVRGALDPVIDDGLSSICDYATRQYAEESHLVLFDQSDGKWNGDRMFVNERQFDGKGVTVWGM